MKKDFRRIDQCDPSVFDPFQTAKAEGDILARGMRGNYRKTPVTRMGYFIMGSLLLVFGSLAIYGGIVNALENGIGEMPLLFFLGVIGFVLIGISWLLFRQLFKRS